MERGGNCHATSGPFDEGSRIVRAIFSPLSLPPLLIDFMTLECNVGRVVGGRVAVVGRSITRSVTIAPFFAVLYV